jgi:hypothetical protein
VGITAGSTEVPGRKLVTRDNNDNNNNNNNSDNNNNPTTAFHKRPSTLLTAMLNNHK